jgi:integrase
MWFANVQGKQTPLNVTDPGDRAGADAAFQALLAIAGAAAQLTTPPVAAPPPPAPVRTVAQAVAGYLASCERRAAAGKISDLSIANYRRAMDALIADYGSRSLESLTAEDLEVWAARPTWSASTQNNYLGTVQQLFRWAGLPLRIHRPPKESRGAETGLTEEQFAKVLEEIEKGAERYGGDLAELLRALRETGARPQELAQLRAEEVDWANACTRRREHKSKRHGSERLIYFNSKALAILKAQVEKHGSGILFRTRSGNPYGANVLQLRLGVISKRVGFRVIAYGMRHAFATRALENGVSDVVVAGLLGHRGTAMLHKHYSHVTQNANLMRQGAEKAAS